jgi:hypothetical protein
MTPAAAAASFTSNTFSRPIDTHSSVRCQTLASPLVPLTFHPAAIVSCVLRLTVNAAMDMTRQMRKGDSMSALWVANSYYAGAAEFCAGRRP